MVRLVYLDSTPVISGVPQVSVVHPLLFTILHSSFISWYYPIPKSKPLDTSYKLKTKSDRVFQSVAPTLWKSRGNLLILLGFSNLKPFLYQGFMSYDFKVFFCTVLCDSVCILHIINNCLILRN